MSRPQPLTAAITVLAQVSSVSEAAEAVAAGAGIVDVGADEALAAAIARAGLDVLICGVYPGAGLRRYELARAQEAEREGIPRERVLVQIPPGTQTPTGWLTVVDVDAGMPASPREAVARAGAVATVSAWLGANVIATRHVREIRRCLDMTESIRGTRPPAWAVRGLG